MPELGDLSNIFKSHVPNLDWLDVDENVYRELERLPKQNLNILPDLENMWSTHEKAPVYFVPNVDLSAFPEFKPKERISSDQVIQTVAKHVKEKMMLGWDGEKVAAWIHAHVDAPTIGLCIPTFRKIAQEQGLLGTVYIDATHWSRCDQGEGEAIARLARQAKFVMGTKSKCSGCMFNSSGRCSKFQKELIFEVVPYTDALVGEYANALRVNAPTMASSDPKERIRALTAKASADPEVWHTIKPTMGPQQKRVVASRTYEPPSTLFASAGERSLYRDLAQKMMAAGGRFSESVRNRIASASESQAISTLRAEENLLGNVYVRPEQFDSCHKANDALRKHSNKAPYILEIPNKCARCTFQRAGSCSLIGKKVVTEVPYTKEFLANELVQLVDAGKLSRKVADGFMARANTESVHDVVQAAYSYEAPPNTTFSGRGGDLVNMGSATAARQAREASGIIPQVHRPVVVAAYKAVYDGLVGDKLRSAIVGRFGPDPVRAAAAHLKPVVAMAGVLGNVVLDLRGFRNPSEAKTYLASKGMKPKYLLREGCCNSCQGEGHAAPCPSHQFPGLQVVPEAQLSNIPNDFVASRIDRLESRGTLTASVASSLRAQIGEAPAVDILRMAYTAGPVQRQGPHRRVPVTPTVSSSKVQSELARASEATTQDNQKKVAKTIEAEYQAGMISERVRDTFVANIGKYSTKDLLVKLAQYKLASLTPSTFAATDVGAQLSSLSVKTAVAAPVVSEGQRKELRTRVAQALNKGLFGDRLKRVIRNSFPSEVVAAEKASIVALVGEQGLMGHHYIDPSPYKTCVAGAKDTYESPGLYVKEMKKCAGCIYRNATNRCSIYDRYVVAEVPYPKGRDVTQDAILNPVVETPITLDSVNVNPLDEFEVGGVDMDIELDTKRVLSPMDVSFDDPLGNL